MKKFFALSLSDAVFIMLLNVKMPTTVGILTFMSRINFMLSIVEHEKFYNLGAVFYKIIRISKHISAIIKRFIVKAKLNSIFTNNLKRKDFFGKYS